MISRNLIDVENHAFVFLTVNGEAKRFMKDKFTTWSSEEVQKQINPGNGDANGEVNVDLRLTALKPLHASWLVDLYNHLSSDIGRCHIAEGGKRLASPNY